LGNDAGRGEGMIARCACPDAWKGDAMMNDDVSICKVVVNDEEQYSIWFVDREPPPGWREVGKEGTKEECLAYIEEVWTDMRPKSLRQRMDDSGVTS
jgi:MbtH protein